MATRFAEGNSGASPFVDVLGLAAPLLNATDVPIDTLYIGGGLAFDKLIEIDAMAGVKDPEFLLSRLFLVGVAGGLVCLSGLGFRPTSRKKTAQSEQSSRGPAMFSSDAVKPVSPKTNGLASVLISEWSQILRPRLFVALLFIVAIAGAVLPLRGMVGPALALLLIFPLTQHGSRWRGLEMSRLTNLSPMSGTKQFAARLGAGVLLAVGLCLPALFQILARGEFTYIRDVAAVGIGLPILAIGLSHVTRGPIAGRIVLLILWYGYLNLGPTPIG